MNNRTWKIALPAALATLGILGLFIYANPNRVTNNNVTVNTVSPNVVSPEVIPLPTPETPYEPPASIDALANEVLATAIEEENIYGNGQNEVIYATSDKAALSNFNRAYDENDVQ